MVNIIVALPKIEDARGIRGVLVKSGFQVTAVCTTGAQALSQLRDLTDGIVICSYKLTDMIYKELRDCLPTGFDMLLLASRAALREYSCDGVVCLAMPLKVHELVSTVEMMCQTLTRRRRREKAKPKGRKSEEEALIKEAKELLMDRNEMSEEEAYRYIQKCSMDSGTNMVETAQMVLAMMR